MIEAFSANEHSKLFTGIIWLLSGDRDNLTISFDYFTVLCFLAPTEWAEVFTDVFTSFLKQNSKEEVKGGVKT